MHLFDHYKVVSQFIRDFNNCPLICKFFSHMANETLAAHTMPMNYSHINIFF